MQTKIKKVIEALLVLVVLVSLVSCGKDKPSDQGTPINTQSPSSNIPTTPPPQGITVNKIDFIEVNITDLNEVQIDQINNFASVGGYYYWADGKGGYIVFIGMGEKPTGGFSIKVLSVEDNEGRTNIFIEEISPKADDVVTQALTYPYIVIEIKGVTNRFSIITNSKAIYELIVAEEVTSQVLDCYYEGQIDNNSIEVKTNDSYFSLRNSNISSMIEGLKKGDPVRVTYKYSSENQLLLESIEKIPDDN